MVTERIGVGDEITVLYGSSGTQLARVVKLYGGRVYVRKYQANSGRWTKTIIEVKPHEIVRKEPPRLVDG